jgi:hypothetical protein
MKVLADFSSEVCVEEIYRVQLGVFSLEEIGKSLIKIYNYYIRNFMLLNVKGEDFKFYILRLKNFAIADVSRKLFTVTLTSQLDQV